MRSMLKLALVLSQSLWASTTRAEPPPPVPEGGINFYHQEPCTEAISGQKGMCYMGKSQDGTTYLTFWQYGVLMMIREVTPDEPLGYKTIWTSPQFNSI